MRDDSGILEIQIRDDVFARILGEEDVNLRRIEGRFSSRLTARGGKICVQGPPEEMRSIRRVFADLEAMYHEQNEVSVADVDTILRLAGSGREKRSTPPAVDPHMVLELPRGQVQARNPRQARYMRMMEKETMSFAIGPAGTGKTYLAVAMAIDFFQRRLVERIILVRPVVESGETLGFLPGDILEKVDPFFRPLYDALYDMLTRERVRRFIDRGMIEIAPLAYMRGRTLNSAFVILDEAQNTTSGQMKMFLTRLGVSSRAVLTGDLTQIDLTEPASSGLIQARELLQGIAGIGFIEFNDQDVVRHKLVADILRAYNGERENRSDA